LKLFSYKKVSFCTDASKDTASFFGFVEDAKYDNGRSLKDAVLDKYPTCKKWFSHGHFIGKRSEVSDFVREEHARYAKDIGTNFAIYEYQWRAVEPKFHELVRKLFGSFPWPRGKYAAYPTIWNMFPRFLDDKTFQIPFRFRKKQYVNIIIAHEMLHFIFYAYFYIHYPQYHGDDHELFVWHVSEIFNDIVQGSHPWLEVFGLPSIEYPEHKKINIVLTRKYGHKREWNIDNLIADIIKNVHNNPCLR